MVNEKKGKSSIIQNLAKKNKIDAISKFAKIKRAVKQPRPRPIK